MQFQSAHLLIVVLGFIGEGHSLMRALAQTGDTPAKIKILCLVLSTDTKENNQKSRAVEQTWGKRCDKLLLIKNGTKTGELDGKLILAIDHEGRDQLWRKISAALKIIHDKYIEQYDWFFRADDDTFLLVDSLRKFLTENSSPNEAIHFGHRFRPYVKSGFMSGGSGIVLSREALRRLINIGFRQRLEACELESGQIDDLILSKCLEAVGVKAGDTRDPRGKETFLPLSPESLLNDLLDKNHWYHTYAYYKESDAITGSHECCSRSPIAFHYITARQMFLYDWLLYVAERSCNTSSA